MKISWANVLHVRHLKGTLQATRDKVTSAGLRRASAREGAPSPPLLSSIEVTLPSISLCMRQWLLLVGHVSCDSDAVVEGNVLARLLYPIQSQPADLPDRGYPHLKPNGSTLTGHQGAAGPCRSPSSLGNSVSAPRQLWLGPSFTPRAPRASSDSKALQLSFSNS